jgi:hypothetical protein
MKYIVFAQKKYGKSLAGELLNGGADVTIFENKESLFSFINTIEDKEDYKIIIDIEDEQIKSELESLGFDVEVDGVDDDEEDEKTDIEDTLAKGFNFKELSKELVSKLKYDPAPLLKKVKDEIFSLRQELSDRIDEVDKKKDPRIDNIISELDTLEKELTKSISDTENKLIDIVKTNVETLSDTIENSKDTRVDGIIESLKLKADNLSVEKQLKIKADISLLKDKADTTEIKKIEEQIKKIWDEIKELVRIGAIGVKSEIVQGTTRLMLYLEGVSLNDTFNELNFKAGTGITLTKTLNSVTRQTDFEIAAPGSTTDEKVAYKSGTTAGYLKDVTVAGTGITLEEGTGGDVGKLKISASTDLSGYLKLDQTTPQITVGKFTFDSIKTGYINIDIGDGHLDIGNETDGVKIASNWSFIDDTLTNIAGSIEVSSIISDTSFSLGLEVPLRKFHQLGGKFLVESNDMSWGGFQLVSTSDAECSFLTASNSTVNNDGITVTSNDGNNGRIWAYGLGAYSNPADMFVFGNNEAGIATFMLPKVGGMVINYTQGTGATVAMNNTNYGGVVAFDFQNAGSLVTNMAYIGDAEAGEGKAFFSVNVNPGNIPLILGGSPVWVGYDYNNGMPLDQTTSSYVLNVNGGGEFLDSINLQSGDLLIGGNTVPVSHWSNDVGYLTASGTYTGDLKDSSGTKIADVVNGLITAVYY